GSQITSGRTCEAWDDEYRRSWSWPSPRLTAACTGARVTLTGDCSGARQSRDSPAQPSTKLTAIASLAGRRRLVGQLASVPATRRVAWSETPRPEGLRASLGITEKPRPRSTCGG